MDMSCVHCLYVSVCSNSFPARFALTLACPADWTPRFETTTYNSRFRAFCSSTKSSMPKYCLCSAEVCGMEYATTRVDDGSRQCLKKYQRVSFSACLVGIATSMVGVDVEEENIWNGRAEDEERTRTRTRTRSKTTLTKKQAVLYRIAHLALTSTRCSTAQRSRSSLCYCGDRDSAAHACETQQTEGVGKLVWLS